MPAPGVNHGPDPQASSRQPPARSHERRGMPGPWPRRRLAQEKVILSKDGNRKGNVLSGQHGSGPTWRCCSVTQEENMAHLFQTSPQDITLHLKNIFQEGELAEEATCKGFLQVQAEAIVSWHMPAGDGIRTNPRESASRSDPVLCYHPILRTLAGGRGNSHEFA